MLKKLKILANASHSESRRRYLSIARGGASALGAKGVSALAVIVSVPLTLHYLGPERYGLWVTLYSIIAWLSLFDLGLSNGLMHVLSEAYGKGRSDLAKSYVSAAVQGLIAIAAIAGVLCVLLALSLDWFAIFNIREQLIAREFSNAIVAAIVLFAISLPLTVVGKVYIAYQKGELANYWVAGATMGGLLGLAVAVKSGGNMQDLVFGFAGGQFLVNALSAVWLFGRAMPELRPSLCFEDHQYRRVFNTSASFFVAQLSTLLVFQSPSVIISNLLSPEHIVPFNVTWNLFLYITVPQTLIGANIWAAISEAHTKKDFVWIKILLTRYMKLSLFYGIPCVVTAVLFYEKIMIHWVGPEALAGQAMVYWMACWALLMVFTQPLVAVVLGVGLIAIYARFNFFITIGVVAAAYYLTPNFGSVAIIVSFVVGSFINILFCYAIIVRFFMDGSSNVQELDK